MMGSADGTEIGKQRQFAQHQHSRPQYRKGGECPRAFTQSQTKIKNWFQP
jgi:hypothetical protein